MNSTVIITILIILYLIGSCLFLSSNNLVICIFLLVLTFISGILIFPFLHAEYVMVIFLIVYLGAIIVFFLFGIMLLNIYEIERVLPGIYEISFISSFLLLIFFSFCFGFISMFPDHSVSVLFELSDIQMYYLTLVNVEKIGLCLFTEFGFTLVICAVLMFVAILGCIMILKKK